jgi:hypothetical protein
MGIDVSSRLIDLARKNDPGLDVRVADVRDIEGAQTFDVVLAQGIFYLLDEDPETEMAALIRRMYDLADHALAFTTISAWGNRRDPSEFHADPLRTIALCREMTPRIVLRHDYHPGDFAIYMYRPDLDERLVSDGEAGGRRG